MVPSDDLRNTASESNRALMFFGAIVASVTHELNNVFGTVEQLSGLLEDLAYGISTGKSVSEEQLNSLSERVTKQTDRGAVLVKRLNAFAHSCDSEFQECKLYETVENLSRLINRLARMKRSEIEVVTPDEEISLRVNPFLLMHILFLVIKKMLPLVKRDTGLQIDISGNSNETVIRISIEYNETQSPLKIDQEINLLVKQLPADVSSGEDNKRLFVDLKIFDIVP